MNHQERTKPIAPALLLAFGIIGSAINFGLGLILIGLGLASSNLGQPENALMAVSLGITFLGLASLGIPLMYWSLQSIRGLPIPARNANRYWILAVVLYPLALVVGYASIESMRLPDIYGPLANFAAASAPVLLAVSLVRLNGPALHPTRSWWHFLSGLWLVPPIVFAIEILALIPILFTMGIVLLGSESGRNLVFQLSRLDLDNLAQIDQLAQGLLQEPLVVILIFLLFSVLVPVIEEAAKTIVVWPLIPRNISPAEGFLGGAIGGAGFALFESLFLAQQAGLWFASMLGRTGTSFIHALGTGLACWGLVKSIQKRQLRWCLLGYGLAVVIHGGWNAAALGIGISSISLPYESQLVSGEINQPILFAGVSALIALTVSALISLVALMRKINATAEQERLSS